MPCSRCSHVPTQLQPPPEMAAAPPRCASFSRITTWAPASCASRPAATPTALEPTIKTSVCLDLRAGMFLTPPLGPFHKSCASALLLGAPGSSPAPEATLERGDPRDNPGELAVD